MLDGIPRGAPRSTVRTERVEKPENSTGWATLRQLTSMPSVTVPSPALWT